VRGRRERGRGKGREGKFRGPGPQMFFLEPRLANTWLLQVEIAVHANCPFTITVILLHVCSETSADCHERPFIR